MSISEYNADIKLITFEICLIHKHKPPHLVYNFKKILIILVNDSSDSSHLSIFIVLDKKKKKKDKQKRQQQQAEQKHNLLVSILVFVCDLLSFCTSYLC